MTWVLYSLIKGRDGRKPSEFSVAAVSVNDEWKVIIDCPNREMFRKLRDFFGAPMRVRVHIAKPPGFYSYGWKEVEPGSEQHFREALNRLHQINMVAVMLDDAGAKGK